jgi:hypothetical protein
MVNLMEDSKKHELKLGPWKPELFLDVSRPIRSRIKLFFRRNHPCQQIPNGLDKLDHPQLRVYHCPNFSMITVGLRKSGDTMPSFDDDKIRELESRCHIRPRENAIWYDAGGEKLVHYFACALTSIQAAEVIKEFRDLVEEFTPTAPAPSEKRSARFLEWRDHIGTAKKSGVIRLTFHHQRNHSHQKPPNPSSDFVSKSGKKTTAAAEFRKSRTMIDVADTISIMFAAVDPYTWRRYRDVYVDMASKFRLVKECDPNGIQCFVGHYTLINMLTTPHWDTTDPPRGWVAMLVVGDFREGELCIPELDVAIPYQSGDVVFLRSWMLLHFIKRYRGPERYVVVYATTYSIFEWLDAAL